MNPKPKSKVKKVLLIIVIVIVAVFVGLLALGTYIISQPGYEPPPKPEAVVPEAVEPIEVEAVEPVAPEPTTPEPEQSIEDQGTEAVRNTLKSFVGKEGYEWISDIEVSDDCRIVTVWVRGDIYKAQANLGEFLPTLALSMMVRATVTDNFSYTVNFVDVHTKEIINTLEG